MPKLLTDAAVTDIRRMKADIRRLYAEVERQRYANEPVTPHWVIRTPEDGIPPINAQDHPGEAECKIIRRWQQGKYLEALGGNTAGTITVYNPFDVPVAGDTVVVAHRDPWGDLYVGDLSGGTASFFYTGGTVIPAASTPYSPGVENVERLDWDGMTIAPFSTPRFEDVYNSCLNDIAANVVIIATKINGDWFVIVEDCNQPAP